MDYQKCLTLIPVMERLIHEIDCSSLIALRNVNMTIQNAVDFQLKQMNVLLQLVDKFDYENLRELKKNIDMVSVEERFMKKMFEWLLKCVNESGNNVLTINELITTTQLELHCKTLPPELRFLRGLEVLYSCSNELGAIPIELGDMTWLKMLYLRNNKLTSIPYDIGKLLNLQQLTFSNNSLKQIPSTIGNLSSLLYLDLGYNHLTAMPAEVGNLTNLEELVLTHNQLTTLPSEIGKLTNLRNLYLNYNQLFRIPVEIKLLNNLYSLHLKGNRLVELPPKLYRKGLHVYRD
jgi:Leucine-rich repeat (LRR) protein